MLKQSPSRNLSAKSLKVKHALQILLLLLLCIWLIYQVKNTYNKRIKSNDRDAKVSENEDNEYQTLKIGRKHLKPRLDDEVEKHVDDQELVELSEDEEIIKVRENDVDENVDRDDETESGDKEKSEESEHDQLQDLIDEDDKDAQEK